MKIYTNQTNLSLTFATGVDITGACSTMARFKTPGGTKGSWTATILVAGSGTLSYKITTATSLATGSVGTWAFWPFVTFSDGRNAAGETFFANIYNEGA